VLCVCVYAHTDEDAHGQRTVDAHIRPLLIAPTRDVVTKALSVRAARCVVLYWGACDTWQWGRVTRVHTSSRASPVASPLLKAAYLGIVVTKALLYMIVPTTDACREVEIREIYRHTSQDCIYKCIKLIESSLRPKASDAAEMGCTAGTLAAQGTQPAQAGRQAQQQGQA